jgi:FtsZ-interacting cell division protein ZipA
MDDIETLLSTPSRMPAGLLDFLIVIGVILLVVLIVFYWAYAVRKRKNRNRKYRQHHHQKGIREQFQKNAGDIKELIRQRRHGRHREHRSLNPTLAQTGGLPPLREAEKPSPPPPPSPSP